MRIEAKDLDDMRPLLVEIIRQTLAELQPAAAAPHQQVFDEGQAAAYLQMRRHQLRDLRLAKKISFSRGPKGCVRYQLSDLLGYLESNREN